MSQMQEFPKFTEMFKPFLDLHKDGKQHSIFELEEKLAAHFNISKELREKIKASGGLGLKRGFTIEKIMLVPHGSGHNDTIVVVERKFQKCCPDERTTS